MHVVGPQLGLTQPGMTIVCGDSHTSTHGAFGAIAFGIGTSEVEHVLATQTLPQAKPKTMAVTVNGSLPDGVTAKDLVLTLIAHTGTGGGQGYIVEYRGQAIEELSMEARMTVCNMSIEWGAKAGLIAPDQTTFDYIEGRAEAPKGADWDAAVEHWRSLVTDDDAEFDKEIVLDASTMTPFVTWGTNPGQGVPLGGSVPNPEDFDDAQDRIAAEKALQYMGLEAGTPMREVKVDTVFVGSCTNGRIEDLRVAAEIIKGRHVDKDTRLLVVPGSVRVRLQAEDEGLDVVFKEAGGEWRGAGCSMCLGMNPDQLTPGERSASTSNRNFEGRQGKGGRTHLVSVPVAAATADPRHPRPSPADLEEQLTWTSSPRHTGVGVPLRRSNVDTDQIIPAVYLKRVTRTGFEDGLFAAWRNDPDFVLNNEAYAGGSVLVAGPDFGTGSSREHAVWALQNYGFKAVISPRFGDIFRGNSGKAGLVAAQVDEKVVQRLWDLPRGRTPAPTVTVDLESRTVRAGEGPDADRGLLRHRRLHAVAAARGSRRHRHHALARGRHRDVRGEPSELEAGHPLSRSR